MAKLAELRKQAKNMGIAAAVIRSATTASELQSVISDHAKHDGKPRKKTTARKPVRKAVAKKMTGRKVSKPKPAAKKTSARKASTPAKSKTGAKAKRSSTTAKKTTNGYVPKGGRNLLDHVDFSQDDGWNARDGSAPDRIIKALKRYKGNRAKVFEFLKPKVWDFVGKIKTNGEKRTKAEALDMLKYRISRTAWDFAMRTGQHKKAKNRVEYGTGGTGAGTWKPAKKQGAQKRSTGTTRTRKAQTAKKTGGRQKASQSRTRASARKPVKRGRGRPKAGSRR